MFPDFNIFSTPLLILVVQGLILVAMLLHKSWSLKDVSSLLLAILLLITCYHRTTYTIGFLGWYDTFRNTKINYYLIELILAVGPLIYLYIRSVGEREFKMTRSRYFHFLPVIVYFILRVILLIYDSRQDGYDETQNGILFQWFIENLYQFVNIFFVGHLFVYLFFSFKQYYQIRAKLNDQFSNTYKFEMRWLRNFLFLFTLLFLYDTIQFLIENLIVDLHWTEEWWFQFFSLLVVIYVGVKGYFTPLEHLPLLDSHLLERSKSADSSPNGMTSDLRNQLNTVVDLVRSESLYLDPNLSLTSLARRSKIAPSQLSLLVNKGLGKNFNEFINEYRVELVKERLQDEKFKHLSILAIALDTGFNSKATFNRVFKKIDGNSPSYYRN